MCKSGIHSRVSYRIFEFGGKKHGGSRMIVTHESTLTHV